ncbi:hypothetical protein B0H67DRAFT_210003 [Lasiosphaeris hirsuta]|uniref:Uncharacterized protein n=1 Tax=Lasiosphaeris hirsuta TaxID=260670 RepID=A0AA40AS33_9PEZI|nr:hypothetical protein B0H67DRAFT_210003 [Lasiosphaeris hirsuta]
MHGPLQPALACGLGWSLDPGSGILRVTARDTVNHLGFVNGLALCCGPAGTLFPAELIMLEPKKAYALARVGDIGDLTSPGSLWCFHVNFDRQIIELDHPALASTIFSADGITSHHVLLILHRFFASWAANAAQNPSEKWEPRRPNHIPIEDDKTNFYIHSIRCLGYYLVNLALRLDIFLSKIEGVKLKRAEGLFSSPASTGDIPFYEHRMAVIYRWTADEHTSNIPSFRVLVLSDVYLDKSLYGWNDRGFCVGSGRLISFHELSDNFSKANLKTGPTALLRCPFCGWVPSKSLSAPNPRAPSYVAKPASRLSLC